MMSIHNIMKRILLSAAAFAALSILPAAAQNPQQAYSEYAPDYHYVPTAENIASRQDFADRRFGIFLHWGLYSMFAQGEWYMQNAGISYAEYSKAASCSCPASARSTFWRRLHH